MVNGQWMVHPVPSAGWSPCWCSPRQGDPGVALETPETPRRPVDGWRWSSNDEDKLDDL